MAKVAVAQSDGVLNTISEPSGCGAQRVIGKVGVAFGCARVGVAQQTPDHLQAQAARDQVGGIGVPVVVPAVVRKPSLPHHRGPELLDIPQGLACHVAREQVDLIGT